MTLRDDLEKIKLIVKALEDSVISQSNEIIELKRRDEEKSRALYQVYEELKRKKIKIEEFEESCGPLVDLPRDEGSGVKE